MCISGLVVSEPECTEGDSLEYGQIVLFLK